MNIRILQYSTNKWLTELEEIKIAIADMTINYYNLEV